MATRRKKASGKKAARPGPRRKTGEQPARPAKRKRDARSTRTTVERGGVEIEASPALPKISYKLQGPQEPPSPDESLLRLGKESSKLDVRVKASFRPASRAAAPGPPTTVDADDVIEIEFADGIRAWLGADEFLERFTPRATREAASTQAIRVPESLEVLPAPMRSRGPVSWAIKALRVLGVDLAGMAMEEIAKLAADRPTLRRKQLGMHRCVMRTGAHDIVEPVSKAAPAPNGEPMLVLIHGTFSSTWASFGDFWSPERADELNQLRQAYGDRVYGFEHETLLESPVANAIELAEALPDNARVHLVSQSRGGLVGELLCRSGRASTRPRATRAGGAGARARSIEPFDPQEIEALGNDPLAAEVRALDAVLRRKQLVIERFVRVACPALGTTLASGRLDRMLSVISTAAGLLRTGPFAEAFADFGGFLAAIVKKRTQASDVPGIEAMMPESRFMRILNWPETRVSGDLIVIAGDLEADSLLAKSLVWALDRFYESGHDLIVNTPSMYGGAEREADGGGVSDEKAILHALVSEHSGSGVNHFSYFRNRDSAAAIVRGLVRPPGDATGFEPLHRTAKPIARDVGRGPAGPRPIVFILPGIMGSELHVANKPIWLNVGRIVFGGFEQLRLGMPNVEAKAILRSHYGELSDFLSETYEVIEFPFDWRRSINDAADDLAIQVKKALRRLPADKPLRILAHSMGGLVGRTMLARDATLRRDLLARDGFRFVMCGTPNGGSHTIPQLLVGQLGAVRMLGLADLNHDRRELLEIISRFPGVLAMLPRDPREDYFDPATWGRYSQRVRGEWVAPAPADLINARRYRDFLDGAEIESDNTIYVAGCADATVSRMFIEEENGRAKIQFMATTQGDGTVTWGAGIPPNVPTWYMRAKHGDLLRHEDSFRGLFELLETGRTAVLSRTPPVARGVAEEFPLPREADVVYPNDETLASAVLGSTARPARRTKKLARPVTVRVLHGDLKFAENAVMVGHYAGDTIVSAEKALDSKLGGELSRRSQMGVYPRDIETCLAFVERTARGGPCGGFEGAIVVGLGTAGQLSMAALTKTLTRGLIEYALECAMIHRQQFADDGARPPCEIGVSPLLIGTNAGGVSVADSVYAVLRAVIAANAALKSSETLRAPAGRPAHCPPEMTACIARVEFIELWEDRAILAMQALRALTSDDRTADRRLARAFNPELHMRVRKGNRRRTVFEEPPGWWHRVQILGEQAGDGSPQRTLRFTSTTRRARSEVRLLPTQTSQVDAFVKQAIRTTRDDRAVARTLFELLLPNELKDEAPNTDNIVLNLDELSAGYPWELLEDPYGEQKEPFVLQHGVLRQLEVRDPPALSSATTANNALVIGDPMGPFCELKGAQAEAKDVARSLEAGGYNVVAHYRPSSAIVLNALYERPYQILHLAGHGVYRYLPPEVATCAECKQTLPSDERADREKRFQPITGMVLGDNAFLTPVEIQQMRRVPELVFINCCHLGRIEPGVDANERDDYHRFAASVASQFIRMGVRAVIAAGWAVDDREALIFATTFYNHMLGGGRLGESVKAARQAVYEDNPSVNTWGAYQCYGDPDYVLPRSARGGTTDSREPSYSSAAELRADIDNLRAQLSLMAGQSRKWPEEQLKKIVAWREKAMKERGAGGEWLRDGTIEIALARAFGEAELFEEAVKHYQDAIDQYPRAVSQVDVERFVNLTCRSTVVAARTTGADVEKLTAQIDRAVAYIEWLRKAPSSRDADSAADLSSRARWNELLGSAAKRKAWIASTKARRAAALKEMLERYGDAVETSTGCAPVAVLNHVVARLVESWFAQRPPTAKMREQILEAIARLRQQLQDRARLEKDFWIDAATSECDLLEAIVDNTLDTKRCEDLVKAYQRARHLASYREFASVTDQIEFLQEMAGAARKAALARSLSALLETLRKEAC